MSNNDLYMLEIFIAGLFCVCCRSQVLSEACMMKYGINNCTRASLNAVFGAQPTIALATVPTHNVSGKQYHCNN